MAEHAGKDQLAQKRLHSTAQHAQRHLYLALAWCCAQTSAAAGSLLLKPIVNKTKETLAGGNSLVPQAVEVNASHVILKLQVAASIHACRIL